MIGKAEEADKPKKKERRGRKKTEREQVEQITRMKGREEGKELTRERKRGGKR